MKKTVVGQVAVGMLALGFGAISGCSGLPDEHPTLSGTSSSSSSAATSGAGGTSSTGAAGSSAASSSATGTPATTSSSSTGAAGSTSGASGAGGSGGSAGTGGAGGSGGGGTGGKAGGGGAGTGGSTGTGGARDGGSDATVSGDSGGGAATFTAVSAIIATGCRMSGCHHSGTGAGVNNHIDLRADGLYARLMLDVTGAGATAPETACMKTMKLIVPNNPGMSLILGMVGTVTAARMGCGARMPDRCGTAGYPACLTTAQIQTITNWVMAGAPNN